MNLYKVDIEPGYFQKVGNNLFQANLFALNTDVIFINPTVYTKNAGQITSRAAQQAAMVTVNDHLNVPAADYADSVWASAGWNLSDINNDFNTFAQSNLVNCGDTDMAWYIVRKTIDGTPYTVIFAFPGNYTNDVTWEILMSTSGYMNSIPSGFADPGSAAFRTATAANSGASSRSSIGDGAGVYNAFFTKKNITKLALIDGSGGLNPQSNINYLIYDLVESTGEETIYDILFRLDTYLRDTSNFAGNDSFLSNNFYSPSVLNITAGINGYSGLLSSSGGTAFKTNNSQTPDKICIMGINADADNDIQALCAYSGNLSINSGKGDSWRGTDPSQTFWSYWGNDFHSNSQTQRIGSSWQTPPGIASGVSTYSSNVYLLAF